MRARVGGHQNAKGNAMLTLKPRVWIRFARSVESRQRCILLQISDGSLREGECLGAARSIVGVKATGVDKQ